MKYAWAVFRNLIVLYIAIAILGKAETNYEEIVFSLLVLIYLSIDSSAIWDRMVTGMAFLSIGKEFWRIRKLLKEGHISNTTLNPVFSEEEIARKKKIEEKWGRDSQRLFNELNRKEREEIKAHHEAGKDKSSFEPSAALLHSVKEEAEAINIRNLAHDDYEKMIKANLAVINGKPIEEVREGCELHDNGISGLRNGTFDLEEFVKRRKEYWKDCWDDILEKEDFLFLEYEEVKDRDEKEIADAEKVMDKAWIKVYIEGGFISIIFLVALWHLLRGLQIF